MISDEAYWITLGESFKRRIEEKKDKQEQKERSNLQREVLTT